MLNFPAGIANGQLHTIGDESWTFDGVKWNKFNVYSNPVSHLSYAPINPTVGDTYINQDNAKLYVYTANGWIQVTNIG